MTITRTSILFAAVLFLATASAAADDWQHVTPGVDYREFSGNDEDVHVVRIDLRNDDLMIVSTRQAEKGLKVSDYAKRNRAIAAINADYFDDHFNPIGLTIGPCGQWASTRDTTREGVVAIGDHQAAVRPQSDVMDPPEAWVATAVSGWPMLVKECIPLRATELPGSKAFTHSPHPRTAAGVSKDGRTLYFIVADGRRAHAKGFTLADFASFIASHLDVCDVINLDGGGSSAMFVTDRIVNHPSDGVERPVGDHLAVVYRSQYAGCATAPMTSGATTTTTTSQR